MYQVVISLVLMTGQSQTILIGPTDQQTCQTIVNKFNDREMKVGIEHQTVARAEYSCQRV